MHLVSGSQLHKQEKQAERPRKNLEYGICYCANCLVDEQDVGSGLISHDLLLERWQTWTRVRAPWSQDLGKRLFKERGANATVHVRIYVLLRTKMRHVALRCN